MIRIALILTFVSSALAAQPIQDRDTCRAGWKHLTGMVLGYTADNSIFDRYWDEGTNPRDMRQTPTSDGWCRAQRVDFDLSAVSRFDRLEWHAEPADFAANPSQLPERLDIRIAGLRFLRAPHRAYQLSIGLEHSPADGFLILDQITFGHSDKPLVSASAVIGGAFFDDPRAAQMSLPGLHLDQLAIAADLTPEIADLFLSDVSRDDIALITSGLSDAQMGQRSKSELSDAARALPAPHGRLNLTYISERGLGWMQVIAAATQDAADVPAFAMSGARATVDWQPK